jgi:hypothetical protein
LDGIKQNSDGLLILGILGLQPGIANPPVIKLCIQTQATEHQVEPTETVMPKTSKTVSALR